MNFQEVTLSIAATRSSSLGAFLQFHVYQHKSPVGAVRFKTTREAQPRVHAMQTKRGQCATAEQMSEGQVLPDWVPTRTWHRQDHVSFCFTSVTQHGLLAFPARATSLRVKVRSSTCAQIGRSVWWVGGKFTGTGMGRKSFCWMIIAYPVL